MNKQYVTCSVTLEKHYKYFELLKEIWRCVEHWVGEGKGILYQYSWPLNTGDKWVKVRWHPSPKNIQGSVQMWPKSPPLNWSEFALDLLQRRPHSSVGRSSHWCHGGHGFKSCYNLRSGARGRGFLPPPLLPPPPYATMEANPVGASDFFLGFIRTVTIHIMSIALL